MRIEDFVRNHPILYHMAEDGSWPSIQQRGLLSTSELLTLYGYTGPRRDPIESEWRRGSVPIRRDGLPDAVVRDQLVMPPDELSKCLSPGLTPADWYRLVNSRVFFWTSRGDLAGFLSARSYRGSPHVVIELSSSKLIELYSERVTLTPFNTGSTLHGDGYGRGRIRGPETFRRIEDFNAPWVKELVVRSGIPDLSGIVHSVKRCVSTSTWPNADFDELEVLWPEPA